MSFPVDVFISYAPADEPHWRSLEKHLVLLERAGRIRTVGAHKTTVGEDWRKVLQTNLESARVILLLLSPDFFASDQCYDVEVERALEKDRSGTAYVIPIRLRSYDWGAVPFVRLQALPANGTPIVNWVNPDDAWAEVACEVRRVLEGRAPVSTSTRTGDDVRHQEAETRAMNATPASISGPRHVALPQSAVGSRTWRGIASPTRSPALYLALSVLWAAVAVWQSAPWAVVVLGIAILAFLAFLVAVWRQPRVASLAAGSSPHLGGVWATVVLGLVLSGGGLVVASRTTQSSSSNSTMTETPPSSPSAQVVASVAGRIPDRNDGKDDVGRTAPRGTLGFVTDPEVVCPNHTAVLGRVGPDIAICVEIARAMATITVQQESSIRELDTFTLRALRDAEGLSPCSGVGTDLAQSTTGTFELDLEALAAENHSKQIHLCVVGTSREHSPARFISAPITIYII